MMSDEHSDHGHIPADADPDAALRAAFNDIARTELAAPPPECECKCVGGIAPHSDRLCHRRATTLILLHRWGWCDVDPRTVDPPLVDPAVCDESGNMTSYMCDMCADHAEAVAKANVRTMLADPDRFGAHPTCPTCHKHTMRWQDLLERRRL